MQCIRIIALFLHVICVSACKFESSLPEHAQCVMCCVRLNVCYTLCNSCAHVHRRTHTCMCHCVHVCQCVCVRVRCAHASVFVRQLERPVCDKELINSEVQIKAPASTARGGWGY